MGENDVKKKQVKKDVKTGKTRETRKTCESGEFKGHKLKKVIKGQRY